MLNIKKFLSFLLAVAVSAACLQGQDVGEEAPGFSYQSLGGDTVRLSDFAGKVVFLFLFGNGCPSCKAYGNQTETKVQQVYGMKDDFQALGLDLWNSTSSVTTVTAFKSTTEISYPLLLKAGDMEQKYTTTYDRIIVIDKDGIIRHKGSTIMVNDLDNAISVIEDLFTTTGTTDLAGTDGSPVIGLYPNPVGDHASIHLNLEREATVETSIYDLTGQEILSLGKESFPAGNHIRRLPAKDLPAGIYLLRSVISGQVYTLKMVVH
jgi:peroxiredoxin